MKNILSKSLSSYIIIYFTTSFFFDTNGTAEETSRFKKNLKTVRFISSKIYLEKKKKKYQTTQKKSFEKRFLYHLTFSTLCSLFFSERTTIYQRGINIIYKYIYFPLIFVSSLQMELSNDTKQVIVNSTLHNVSQYHLMIKNT